MKESILIPNKEEFKLSIEFYVFVEDGLYISYCPSLDISTSGETYNEAIGNFYEMLQLHIECCTDNNTLYDDLKSHGWKLDGENILPPSFMTLMEKPEMSKLMQGNIGFEKIVTPARIPVACA
jgi:predicted RNase H-like HicB family nuclease